MDGALTVPLCRSRVVRRGAAGFVMPVEAPLSAPQCGGLGPSARCYVTLN